MKKLANHVSPVARLVVLSTVMALTIAACTTPAADSPTSNEGSPASQPTPAKPVETVTVLLEDGTEVQEPLAITSYVHLLDRHIQSGEWTQAQGLTQLLRLLTGEISESEISDASLVVGKEFSGVIRMAYEFVDDPASDPQAVAEISDLLARLVPSEELLDAISSPAPQTSRRSDGVVMASFNTDDAISTECQNLVRSGFSSEYIPAEGCYYYQERTHDGHAYRLYYPRAWADDSSHDAYIDNALTALVDSASTYGPLGRFESVSAMVSLIPYSEDTDDWVTEAFQSSFRFGRACPLTFLPAMEGLEDDNFKQIVAHEAFHCFQEWNYTGSPYRLHKWWMEGSAEFFSNVVYPDTNNELQYLGQFDRTSAASPLMSMEYENYIFFQYLANQSGITGVLDLLAHIDDDPSAAGLAGYPGIDTLFQDFVVKYMSTGITDTNGDIYRITTSAISGARTVTPSTLSINTNAFVATRYRLEYPEGKQYHQVVPASPEQDAVLTPQLRNLDAWDDLPEDVTGTCEDSVSYTLVTTTDEPTATLSVSVEESGPAACDSCVVGAWQLDNDSMEAFVSRIAATTVVPVSYSLEILGNEYYQFLEDGTVFTRRDGFTFAITVPSYSASGTITVDSQGIGVYGAMEGDMTLGPIATTVNSVTTDATGVGHQLSGYFTPFITTVVVDGIGGSTDGTEAGSVSDPLVTTYSCNASQMVIDHELYGPTILNRIGDDTAPTPFPTIAP